MTRYGISRAYFHLVRPGVLLGELDEIFRKEATSVVKGAKGRHRALASAESHIRTQSQSWSRLQCDMSAVVPQCHLLAVEISI